MVKKWSVFQYFNIYFQEKKDLAVEILLALTVIFTIFSEVTTWKIEEKEGKITEAMLFSNQLDTNVTNDLTQNFKFTYLAFNHAPMIKGNYGGITDPILKNIENQFNSDGDVNKFLDNVADRLLVIGQLDSMKVNEANINIELLKQDKELALLKLLRGIFAILGVTTTVLALNKLIKEYRQQHNKS